MRRYQICLTLTFLMVMIIYGTSALASSEEWVCSKCGNRTTGKYCNYCGQQKPDSEDSGDYLETIFSSSSGKIGNTEVRLKKGADFINTGSSVYNWDLALTAATLSAQVYSAASGDHTNTILRNLGYRNIYSSLNSVLNQPAVCFGYMPLGDGKNLFTVVVRGTDEGWDIVTDILDGGMTMFQDTGDNIRDKLIDFMETATEKSGKQLKEEDNYFFLTGHSLGGAIANYLSIEKNIMEYAHSDKEKIYTYTFESPHNCVNLAWMDPESMSNAFNYKVVGDAVTNLPNYPGSTTYGKDIRIKVSDLSSNTFRTLFTDASEKTVDDAVSVEGHGDIFGLHDTCLGLIYLMDEVSGDIVIDSSNFPDEYFRELVSQEYDKNKDGSLSEEEIRAVTMLGMPDTLCGSLKGIEFFSELEYLECTSLNLETLDCSNNPRLKEIYVGGSLTSLNVKGCRELRLLACDTNELTQLDVSDCRQLEELYCDQNRLTDLNIHNCIALSNLSCSGNMLKTLDISDCPFLTDVYLFGRKADRPEDVPGRYDYVSEEDMEYLIPCTTYYIENPDSDFDYEKEFAEELCIDPDVIIIS